MSTNTEPPATIEHWTRHTNVYVIRQELGLTQKELAKFAKVSVQSVLRSEQGLHPNLSGRIASALSELSNIPSSTIRREYRACRARNITQFSLDLTSDPNYWPTVEDALIGASIHSTVNYSPVKYFRIYLFDHYGLPTSGIKFCALTGLHSAVLNSVESGRVTWRECRALHRVLSEVLAMTDKDIAYLGQLHDEFYLGARHD